MAGAWAPGVPSAALLLALYLCSPFPLNSVSPSANPAEAAL